VLDTSIDYEAVAGVGFEDLATDVDANGSLDDVDELMMRMAMTGANPVGVEVVTDEHELIGIGEHLSAHAMLGCEGLGIVVTNKTHAVSVLFSRVLELIEKQKRRAAWARLLISERELLFYVLWVVHAD